MTPIQQAIEEFRAKRLRDYRNDPDRMTRDANSASETAKDHVGRWLYELIQNSDDAGASELLVQISNDAVYVADNGGGLGADTIKSLSGTHLSVKPAGCIGRKGLGFKSVYSITRTPHIFSRDDGVVFCPDRATAWLRENNLTCNRVPHQWLPFWISRSEAATKDGALADLGSMTTVVQLPLTTGENVEHLVDALVSLPSHALLTFRSLRKLQVKAGERSFEVVVQPPPAGSDAWIVSDTRLSQPCRWRVARATATPSPDILTEFDDDERRLAEEVSLLIGTPLDERDQVVPASDFLCVHVYYPTEEPSPVRLLLHADMVVKSDRTKIIPLDSSRFNAWVAGKLAELVMEKVKDWYTPLAPASNIRLLLPLPNRDEHPTAAALWNLLANQAKSQLLLPNTEGKRVLTIEDARVVTTTVSRADARVILSGGGFGPQLLLEVLERDDEARRVLLELGCEKLSDEDVFSTIKTASSEHAKDQDWIWACWRWLAAWAAVKRRTDFTGERLKLLKQLPVLPVIGECVAASALTGKILTWRDASLSSELPDWLPIRFVDDWLRERIFALPDDDPIRNLLADLGVEPPNENLVLKALEKAIAAYWSEPNGNPGRFINLLLAGNLHEQHDVTAGLRRCPIIAQVEGETSGAWVEAQFAYFGREWGESLIAAVYEGVSGVAWARRPEEEGERYKSVLEWLNVTEFPKLIRSNDDNSRQLEIWRVSKRVPGNIAYDQVQSPLSLDKIQAPRLNQEQARALVSLLVRHWRYYTSHTSLPISYKQRRSWYSESVPARWWEELKAELVPPLAQNQTQRVSLAKCWLPNHETLKAVGELLACVDLNCFGEDKSAVEQWLTETVGVRTRLDQVAHEEWRFMLGTQIPALVPKNEANRDGKHEKFFDWYEAALESLAAQECHLSVADSPLLCRKGDQWAYVSRGERWLKDDNELAAVFDAEIWQMTFPSKLHAQAKKFFGLAVLSDARQEAKWDASTGREDVALQDKLDAVKPYVFVWRCYHTKLEHALLRGKLQRLRVRVAYRLEAVVVLSEFIPAKVAHMQVAVTGDALMLAQDSSDLPCLAEVLARALDIPSESDFFENLLRCTSHGERARKLEAGNCPAEQIERLLAEYQGDGRTATSSPVAASENERPPQANTKSTSSTTDGKTASPEADVDQAIKKPVAQEATATSPKLTTDESETSQPRSESHSEQSTGKSQASEGSATDRQEPAAGLSLKDPSKTAIVVKSQPADENPPRKRERQSSELSQTNLGDAPNESSTSGQQLSHEQKMEVERQGREFATRHLNELGFDVTSMPSTSPGYDLLAKKAVEILRVEVKGHLGKAKIIDLTIRELREYARSKTRNDSDRWELWNVEQLGGDPSTPVEITRYAEIPEEAIEAKLLRVDLRQCASV